jgi:hypothetical protein
LDEVCGIENLSKESLVDIYKEIEKDYLETIEKEPKINFQPNLIKNYHWKIKFCFTYSLIKEYVKQNFPSLKIAKGFTEKQQKEFFGPFYKENVDIPIYENLVCMQFSGFYPNLWLDFQRQKIEEEKVRNLDICLTSLELEKHSTFWVLVPNNI